MTSPILPIVPTGYRPSAHSRAPVVTPTDDARSPGPGLPSGGAGTEPSTTVGQVEPDGPTTIELVDPGERGPVGDYLIAAAEAQHAADVTVVDRDRAIAAFTDIMRMQI